MIWSPWMEDSFPLVLERRARWASRYPFVWYLPALYREELDAPGPVACRPGPEMSAEELHLAQVKWKAEQSASFQEYLRRRNPEAVVDGSWPLVPATG